MYILTFSLLGRVYTGQPLGYYIIIMLVDILATYVTVALTDV